MSLRKLFFFDRIGFMSRSNLTSVALKTFSVLTPEPVNNNMVDHGCAHFVYFMKSVFVASCWSRRRICFILLAAGWTVVRRAQKKQSLVSLSLFDPLAGFLDDFTLRYVRGSMFWLFYDLTRPVTACSPSPKEQQQSDTLVMGLETPLSHQTL